MTVKQAFPKGRRLCAALLVGTMLGGFGSSAVAQTAQTLQPATTEAAQPAPTRIAQRDNGILATESSNCPGRPVWIAFIE